jgi:hypothetical protein
MPFDPSGSCTAQVQGVVSDSQVDAPMLVTFVDTLGAQAPGDDLVDLTGTWQWAGLGGAVDGFWHPLRDSTRSPTFCGSCEAARQSSLPYP